MTAQSVFNDSPLSRIMAIIAVAAGLLTARTTLGQVDLAAQSRAAADYLNKVRANPAAFAKFSASLADADVEARPSLTWNAALQKAAERHAKHMADTGQWGHFMTIGGQQIGMNQWMREAGYPLVASLRNDDTNFECIHWENGRDLNTIGQRTIEGFLAEGKDGAHVVPILGRKPFWKDCKHVGVGMATDASGKTYVSLLVGVYDPFDPNAQPPGQPADANPAPVVAAPAPASAPVTAAPASLKFQKDAVGGGAFASSVAADGSTQWAETGKDPDVKTMFAETKRDQNFIYLFDAGRKITVALPIAGGMSQFSQDGSPYAPLCKVTIVGAATAPLVPNVDSSQLKPIPQTVTIDIGQTVGKFTAPTPPFSAAEYPTMQVRAANGADWAVGVLGLPGWKLDESIQGRFSAGEGCVDSNEELAGLHTVIAKGERTAVACVSYICVTGPGAHEVNIGIHPMTPEGATSYQGWKGDHFSDGPAINSNGAYWYRLPVVWKSFQESPEGGSTSVFYAKTYRHRDQTGKAQPFKLWAFRQVVSGVVGNSFTYESPGNMSSFTFGQGGMIENAPNWQGTTWQHISADQIRLVHPSNATMTMTFYSPLSFKAMAFDGTTPVSGAKHFTSGIAGTTWTYQYRDKENSLRFGRGGVIENFPEWTGVTWKPISPNQLLLVYPDSRTMTMTFDSRGAFSGTDFDGQTTISGKRKQVR